MIQNFVSIPESLIISETLNDAAFTANLDWAGSGRITSAVDPKEVNFVSFTVHTVESLRNSSKADVSKQIRQMIERKR